MAVGNNPYYNPTYAAAAENIAAALRGNPEKAGALAYQEAQTRLSSLRGDRQEIENMALDSGLFDALSSAGQDPAGYAEAMPAVLASFARAGVNDPSKFLSPQWAITGMAQAPTTPDEQFARAAYIGAGRAVPDDLALTPQRSDAIRAGEYAAEKDRALAVQALRNIGRRAAVNGESESESAAPAATPPKKYAPIKLTEKDIERMIADALIQIPGATNEKGNVRQEILTAIPGDVRARAKAAGEKVYQDTRNQAAASAALLEALGLPQGAQFGTYDPPGLFNRQKNVFVGPEGELFDFSAPVAPPPASSSPVAVQSPEEALALPPGTMFITPDGRVKVRP